MPTRVTDPAEKYGPTPTYGLCEAGGCESAARTTCAVCAGDYCLRHAGHDAHDAED